MMGDRSETARYLENWQDEVDSAAEYRAMASGEPDPRLAKVYTNLAAMEEAHVAFWEARLRTAGAPVPVGRSTRRAISPRLGSVRRWGRSGSRRISSTGMRPRFPVARSSG
jgi:hypothetical protein